MAYYQTCTRCQCTMDAGEGVNYPGKGRVCEECARELDLKIPYRDYNRLADGKLKKQEV